MKNILILTIAACMSASAGMMPVSARQVMSWDDAYVLADKKLKELTLEEKKGFMLGHSDFYFFGVPDKGIPYIYLSDASQGVHIRKNLTDTTLVRQLDRSTAFPAPIMLTATFNPDLAYDYARSVGEECRAGGIEVLLGPGVNITKNAQNGRNYEYMGEDPYLSGLMASNYVRGMQSTGTAACLKHFIGNETEFYRRRSNSIIDERALHEVYMAPFRAGIEAGAAYVMTSYNRVNGEWAGQSAFVIDTLLRRDLGFRGSVMSDWRSVYDPQKVIYSGQNTVMPGNKNEVAAMKEVLASGRISEADIDAMIRPVIATGLAFGLYDRDKYKPELLDKYPEHVEVAYRTAAEGVVLLCNNGILPLTPERSILVIGKYLDGDPRLEAANTSSSADVEGYDFVSLRQALTDKFGSRVTFAGNPTEAQLREADVVLAVVGTVDMESFERPFALPAADEKMVRDAVAHNPNTIVTVVSGSGIRMTDWNDRAAAVLYSWYPGQTGMRAVTDILAGDVNPSGKLPLTIDREFSQSPCSGIMPKGAQFYNTAPKAFNEALISLYDIPYSESVLVGYRWYDAKDIKPLYPFGHGLSYTTFSISKPQVKVDGDRIRVRVNLTNTGTREGAEVVQLYVGEDNPTVLRPRKELKGIRKVSLAPGRTQTVEMELDRNDLAFWNDRTHGWQVNPGAYTLYIGNSSDNIAYTLPVNIKVK